MSNDLISRRTVIELIENCHVLEDAYCLIDYINEIPTAYDVDKVVEWLEKRIKNFKSLNSDDEIVDIAIKEIQRDIEIVKSGGVN